MSLKQRIIWRLEAFAYDGVSCLFALIPFAGLSKIGGKTLRLIGPLTSKQKIVRRNIEIAFPDMNEAERRALITAQWDNIGRLFFEFLALHRLKVFVPNSRITVEGLEKLDQHKPAVMISGHFANWEVMAMVFAQYGQRADFPSHVTYRKINNPYIDARIQKQRQAYGIQLLVQKSGARGARELIQALKDGESVALLNDQKFNEGLSVPLFGTPAMTASGPVRLALKSGRPLLPMCVSRKGARFHVKIFDPIELEKTGDRAADLYAGVEKVNQFIEARILDTPDQWFWVHRRWPKAQYRREE